MNVSRASLGSAAFGVSVLVAVCAAAEPQGVIEAGARSVGAPLTSFTLVPGIVADPGRGLVYAMRPAGGIEALAIGDGSVRWTFDRTDQVLFASDEVLVARAASPTSRLMVALLDPESGEPTVVEPIVLSLPFEVVSGIDQSRNRSFAFSVLETGGEVYLTWDYIEFCGWRQCVDGRRGRTLLKSNRSPCCRFLALADIT